MENSIIIALDFEDRLQVMDFLKQFEDEKLYLKVGMELFYKEGADIIKTLKDQGHQIFLDLKCHDIPNTVRKAMYQLKNLGVDMVNVHAAGGKEMMKAAKEAFGEQGKIIAVTQLTSISEKALETEQLISVGIEESVKNYAKITKESGLDGVVCSAHEAATIHKHCGQDFLTICPGIRLSSDDKGDQKRIMTPQKARENEADYIVVGRSITQSDNPYETYKQIEKMWYAC